MKNHGLKVCATPRKGRGVFASTAFAAGEVLESAPTITLSEADSDALKGTILDDYYLAHPENQTEGLIVMGLAMLCNHSEAPNVDTEYRRDEATGWFVELRANQAISAGEEIRRRYACPPWFEPVE